MDMIGFTLAETLFADVCDRPKGITVLYSQNTALLYNRPFLFGIKPRWKLIALFRDLLLNLSNDLADTGMKRVRV